MIRCINWHDFLKQYTNAQPFDHAIIDNFFLPEVAEQLASEFPDYNDPTLNQYNNAIENKKTLNVWDRFPATTYKALRFLGSEFKNALATVTHYRQLEMDWGLHGGGQHMHSTGGNLNVHLDYNIHPKLGLQRKINLIVYLSKDWDAAWGGSLSLWSHDAETNQPRDKIVEIAPVFNRAVIFDTTQMSWHGLPGEITCPEGRSRNSIAVYYLQPAPADADPRAKALFAPREDQKGDPAIAELIAKRSSVQTAHNVTRKGQGS